MAPGRTNETPAAAGSRFAPLETETDPAIDSEAAAGSNVNSGNGDHAGDSVRRVPNQLAAPAQPSGNSRRQNVIANEKQINNEPYQEIFQEEGHEGQPRRIHTW